VPFGGRDLGTGGLAERSGAEIGQPQPGWSLEHSRLRRGRQSARGRRRGWPQSLVSEIVSEFVSKVFVIRPDNLGNTSATWTCNFALRNCDSSEFLRCTIRILGFDLAI
jgi:hypothetical protein